MLLKLIALVVPLGLDTFAVATALGMAGLSGRERLRVSTIFAAFEMGMPLVGLLGGGLIGRVAGRAADYIAIAALVALGAFMLWHREDEDEEARAGLLAQTRGLAVLGLGVSISLDELAIGFTLGLLRVPLLLAIILIGVQAFVVAQAGIRLGGRVGEAVREGAERLAGAVLAALGLFLLIQKLLEH